MTHIFRIARSLALPLTLAASALSLAACSGAGEDVARTVGLIHDAPDEFVVTTRAPLVLPPDLNKLPAPTPGAARPQERSARDAAQLTLAPQTVSSNAAAATPSPGEKSLLKASPQPAVPGVRAEVDHQAAEDADRSSFGDKLRFWKDKPTPGVALDAQGESQRLRQNAVLGHSVSDGTTPIERPNSKPTWIERAVNGSGDSGELAPGAAPAKSKSWYDIF